MKKLLLLISVISISLFSVNFLHAAEVKVGVQAPRGSLKAMTRWSEVGKYLTTETGVQIKIVPLAPNKTVKAVADGKVDFMLANARKTWQLTHRYHEEKNGCPICWSYYC